MSNTFLPNFIRQKKAYFRSEKASMSLCSGENIGSDSNKKHLLEYETERTLRQCFDCLGMFDHRVFYDCSNCAPKKVEEGKAIENNKMNICGKLSPILPSYISSESFNEHCEENPNMSSYYRSLLNGEYSFHPLCRGTIFSELDFIALKRESVYLMKSGMYYPNMRMNEAKVCLSGKKVGTFLIRNSSQSLLQYTLSVQTSNGFTNVRIIHKAGSFELDSNSSSKHFFPVCDNILVLIQFYIKISQFQLNLFVWEHCLGEKNAPVTILQSYREAIPTLAHLCRLQVNKQFIKSQIVSLPLNDKNIKYLLDYPYWI